MVLARRASPVSSPDAVGGGLARVRYRKKAGSNNVDLHYLKARHQGFDSQECFPSSVLGCTDLFSTFIVGHRSVWFYNRVCLDLIDNDILKSCSPVKKTGTPEYKLSLSILVRDTRSIFKLGSVWGSALPQIREQ